MPFYITSPLNNFYPRPPGGGRLLPHRYTRILLRDFYPRPPGGGRPGGLTCCVAIAEFLSTPSGWRATVREKGCRIAAIISIHALRVEGDKLHARRTRIYPYFYPRPPGGGRRLREGYLPFIQLFLSTPSGWRATTGNVTGTHTHWMSIHALRVEGDGVFARRLLSADGFLSTPSGWRATKVNG